MFLHVCGQRAPGLAEHQAFVQHDYAVRESILLTRAGQRHVQLVAPMIGIVNRMVRHRCACGGNFELIAFDDVLVVRGDVGTRQVAER